MTRTCTVCTHRDRETIEKALVAGEAVRAIASRYVTLSHASVQRHKDEHLPETLLKARQAQDVARADTLLDQVRRLQEKALGILDAAEAAGDLREALGAIREARGNLELLAKLVGELDERPTVALVTAPEWLRVRSVLLAALAPYPDARIAVAERLGALGAADGH